MSEKIPDGKILPVEVVALADLKPHPRNYNGHPADQLAHIAKSIDQNGVYRNLVISRDDFILAGHGVAAAAGQAGLEQVRVVRMDYDHDDPRAIKLMIADNEISHLREKDDRLLTDMLKEISSAGPGELIGTGYDEMMLANLAFVTRPASELPNKNAANEWVGLPGYEEGKDSIKIMINFASKEDRLRFAEQAGIEALKEDVLTWTMWWPKRDRCDSASIAFEPGEDPSNDALLTDEDGGE